ncbi:MAG: ATP-binding protein [Vicinamibacterales bacterium]
MDADTQRRILEPFFTTKADGAGLGLTMVQCVVDDLAGAVDRKRPGVGSTFRVWLPRGAADRPALHAADRRPNRPVRRAKGAVPPSRFNSMSPLPRAAGRARSHCTQMTSSARARTTTANSERRPAGWHPRSRDDG